MGGNHEKCGGVRLMKEYGKMSGKIFRSVAAFCLIASLYGTAGCADSGKGELKSGDVHVWSASSDIKYEKSDTSGANDYCVLDYNVVRNEYESKQILITPSENIQNYDLSVADLKCGENVISAENISVYMERYVYINSGADSTVYGQGYYPDALVPIDAAREAGELTAKANENSALWVCIYIPEEIEAGVYTADFTLKMDGLEKKIPVSVTVADYTLTDAINAKSSFTWRYNRVGSGEMDYTTEMFDYYYRFFQDYRISLENPVVDFVTGEEYVSALTENWDKITNYTFNPYWGELGAADGQWGITSEQVLGVAAASSPERNLLEKAMFYFIDEPDLSDDSVLLEKTVQIRAFNNRLKELVSQVEKDTSGKFDDFRRIENWQECILDIPNVVTIDMEDLTGRLNEQAVIDFLNECNCLCPVWRNVSLSDFGEMKEIFENEYGIEVWWYGCVQPTAPYANYHIGDTNLLNARTISWLQKKYDIEGNLYWDAAAYTSYATSTYGIPVDVYESPYRAVGSNTDVAGDGFLTYPGAKYGIYGPIPSMRLMSIRDGMEDYELLLDLENKYSDVAEQLGTDVDSMMSRLYDGLYYNGSMMLGKGDNGLDFDALRAELIDLLVSFDDGTDFYITKVEAKQNYATVSFCANSAEYSVFIGTKEITPAEGNFYEYTVPLSGSGRYTFRLRHKETGEIVSRSRYLATAVNYLIDFDTMNELPEGIVLTEDSQAFVNTDENWKTSSYSLGLTLSSRITGNVLKDLLYEVSASLSSELFDINFGDAVYLHFDLYNANSDYDNVTIILASGTSSYECTTMALKPGVNSIDVSLQGFVFSKINEVDNVILRFDNRGTVENPYIHRVFVDNVYAVMEGEMR